MLANLIRAAFLLFLAVMVVSWAAQVGKSAPVTPPVEHAVVTIYC